MRSHRRPDPKRQMPLRLSGPRVDSGRHRRRATGAGVAEQHGVRVYNVHHAFDEPGRTNARNDTRSLIQSLEVDQQLPRGFLRSLWMISMATKIRWLSGLQISTGAVSRSMTTSYTRSLAMRLHFVRGRQRSTGNPSSWSLAYGPMLRLPNSAEIQSITALRSGVGHWSRQRVSFRADAHTLRSTRDPYSKIKTLAPSGGEHFLHHFVVHSV